MLRSIADILIVVIAIIFVASTVASRSLDGQGLDLPFGWQSTSENFDSPLAGAPVCSESTGDSHGFPFTEKRGNEQGCLEENNKVAFIFNNGIYAASYLLVAGAVIMIARKIKHE